MNLFDKHAFPVSELNGQGQMELTDPGMTLRDYFAAKALIGLCSMVATGSHGTDREKPEAGLAKQAYSMADAMLKAREQS